MKNDDVELIHRILAGDETAFETLVKKYQKQVHALAWRKIGDFHIAEEITQDTFLKSIKTNNAERSKAVLGMALRHRESAMSRLAPKKTD